jgi:hypothetical protein
VLWNIDIVAIHLHGRTLRQSMIGDARLVSMIKQCQPWQILIPEVPPRYERDKIDQLKDIGISDNDVLEIVRKRDNENLYCSVKEDMVDYAYSFKAFSCASIVAASCR